MNTKFSIVPEISSKRVHSKRIPKFSKTFPGIFTVPFSFGPEISEILVEWKAPRSSRYISADLGHAIFVNRYKRTQPELSSTKVRRLNQPSLQSRSKVEPNQVSGAAFGPGSWFKRRSSVVLNSSVRFGAWMERRLERALFSCDSICPLWSGPTEGWQRKDEWNKYPTTCSRFR